MFHNRTSRFLILALAFPMLMPAGSIFASLISVDSAEHIELNSGSTNSAPTPDAPADQKQFVLNLIYGLSSTLECSTNSITIQNSNGYCESICCLISDPQSEKLCLTDFQFVPEAEPDARDKPPKSPIVK